METNREKLLDRLRKLYALGSSPNQHEAEAAMAKAAQLMEEHQISATEVDLQEAGHIGEVDFVVAKGDGVRHWVYLIGRAAALMFDGDVAMASAKTSVTFIGTPTDIEAMKMTFVHLYKSWESIVEHDLRQAKAGSVVRFQPRDTMRYKHGHGVGFAAALVSRARELQKERQAHVNAQSATGRSLIVVKGVAVTEYMKSRYRTKNKSGTSQGSMSGQIAGYAAGEKIPLHGGIGSKSVGLIGRK